VLRVKRATKRAVAHILARAPSGVIASSETFDIWERAGYHVTRNHFYEPVPDVAALRKRPWTASECVGIDLDVARQLATLRQLSPFAIGWTGYEPNSYYGSVDAVVLHALIRWASPKTVVEVGSGFSTRIILDALAENDAPGRLISIEPYEPERMPTPPDFAVPVQEVPREVFTQLQANDVLFIDSSHVLATGNDVWFEYLELLPRLARGVIVHVHDIFIPRDYPKEWVVDRHRFWTEQYVLQAFLAFNSAFEVLVASNHLAHEAPGELEAALGVRAAGEPGSFWLRRHA
jgi:Methyltransferase domain